jgi:hypothetical protein
LVFRIRRRAHNRRNDGRQWIRLGRRWRRVDRLLDRPHLWDRRSRRRWWRGLWTLHGALDRNRAFERAFPLELGRPRGSRLFETSATASATRSGLDKEHQSRRCEPFRGDGCLGRQADGKDQHGAKRQVKKARRCDRSCAALPPGERMAEKVVRSRWSRLETSQHQHGTNRFAGRNESGVARDDPARFEESLGVANRSSRRAGDFASREDVVRGGG